MGESRDDIVELIRRRGHLYDCLRSEQDRAAMDLDMESKRSDNGRSVHRRRDGLARRGGRRPTCHVSSDYVFDDDEWEFIQAVQRERDRLRVRSLPLSGILRVLKSLGWKK